MGTSPSPTVRLPAAGPGRDGRSKLWVFSRLSRNATVRAGRSDVATTAFDVAPMTSSFGVRWEETATGGLSFDADDGSAVLFQGVGDPVSVDLAAASLAGVFGTDAAKDGSTLVGAGEADTLFVDSVRIFLFINRLVRVTLDSEVHHLMHPLYRFKQIK